ncbi:hypothetical protein [Allokutzneria oryzae]|uniref:DUF1275 domain-containing protein n=1 Tax=Allokutzneria oryzae TaxID=1378989 RepID=A0ABV6A9M5_9PSEU
MYVNLEPRHPAEPTSQGREPAQRHPTTWLAFFWDLAGDRNRLTGLAFLAVVVGVVGFFLDSWAYPVAAVATPVMCAYIRRRQGKASNENKSS